MRRAWILMLWMPAGSLLAQETCPHPWTVVVKKDGTTVEGPLVKDTDSGVLLEVRGQSILVKEADIEDVVEDCSRRAPLKPAAPAVSSRDTANDFRTSVIDVAQSVMRLVGGSLMGLGGSIFSTGVLVAVVTTIPALMQVNLLLPTLLAVAVLMALFGAVSLFFFVTGLGLFLGARVVDLFRPSSSAGSGDAESH